LRDYGKRPPAPLATITRIMAPEKNTYTVGCSLGAAYAYAALTGAMHDFRDAAKDAEWLMPRCRRLSGATAESFMFAHALAPEAALRRTYGDYLRKKFLTPLAGEHAAWWLRGGGRSALDLSVLAYCRNRIEDSPRLRAQLLRAVADIFSRDGQHSVYRLFEAGDPTHNEWIYLCYGALGLAAVGAVEGVE
jgi:hypothetical protein